MKKLMLIFLMLCGTVPVGAQKYIWKIAGQMTHPVWGGQLAYDIKSQGNLIYILGGYSDSTRKSVDWIQEYDIANNKWSIVGHMKRPREQFVADIWNNQIMYFGDSLVNNTTLESWDFKTANSIPVIFDSTNSNFDRSYSTGHIVGNNLYIVGGLSPTGTTLPYIVGYDLMQKQVTLTSKEITSSGKPRQHMSFIIGDNIYIFGGATIGISDSTNRFNIPTTTLSTLSVNLLEHRAAGAAVYNPIIQKGFIIGGYNETNKAMATVEQVTIGQDGTLSIISFPSLNKARTDLMAVNYKGRVVVIGGKDENGKSVPEVELLDTLVTSVVVSRNDIPADFALHQNYPNPFNPSTIIVFDLAKPAHISLNIYSVLGQYVKTLETGDYQAGSFKSVWNGKDKFNNTVPSGIYFLQLRAGNFMQTRKMIMLK
jgi:FlgD Ig-like domain/Kelch motif